MGERGLGVAVAVGEFEFALAVHVVDGLEAGDSGEAVSVFDEAGGPDHGF